MKGRKWESLYLDGVAGTKGRKWACLVVLDHGRDCPRHLKARVVVHRNVVLSEKAARFSRYRYPCWMLESVSK